METTTQKTSLVDYYNSLMKDVEHPNDGLRKVYKLSRHICSLITQEIITSDESYSCLKDELKGYSLDDFRSTFEWDERYGISISYEMMIDDYEDSKSCSSKEEMMKYLNGETSVEEHPSFDNDDFSIDFWGENRVRPNIWVKNLRLKEQVSNQFVVTLQTTDTDFSLETLKGLLPSNVEVLSSTPIEG